MHDGRGPRAIVHVPHLREAMHAAGGLDLAAVSGVLAVHLGPRDPRLVRLHDVASTVG